MNLEDCKYDTTVKFNINFDRGKVVKVIDGDSLHVAFEVSPGLHCRSLCRLYGVDTPELRADHWVDRKRAIEAKVALQELVDGRIVDVVCHGQGKYGRPLVSLFVDNIDVVSMLIELGHGVEYFGGKRRR